jgi:hypothetical protein
MSLPSQLCVHLRALRVRTVQAKVSESHSLYSFASDSARLGWLRDLLVVIGGVAVI